MPPLEPAFTPRTGRAAWLATPPCGGRESPARLDDARDLTRERQLAEADAAQAEITQEAARPPAAMAAGVGADLELRRPLPLLDDRLLGHPFSLPLTEGHAHEPQQLTPLLVGPGGRDERHVHAPDLPHLIEVDLGKDDLLGQAHRVVAAPVERPRVQAPEVADTRHRHVDEAVVELPH